MHRINTLGMHLDPSHDGAGPPATPLPVTIPRLLRAPPLPKLGGVQPVLLPHVGRPLCGLAGRHAGAHSCGCCGGGPGYRGWEGWGGGAD